MRICWEGKDGGAVRMIDEKTIKAAEPVLTEGAYWYRCPHCGKALFPVRNNTRIEHMPFRCKACKHDIEVNVFPTKMNNLRAKSL